MRNKYRTLILILLFIAGFIINLEANYIFTWLHELGHVITGLGAIVSYNMSSVYRFNSFWDPVVWYSGTYGEIIFETLIIGGFVFFGRKLYIPVFVFGALLTGGNDPWELTDWLGSSIFAKSFFIVWFVVMIVINLIAIRHLIIKWYYPEEYTEIKAFRNFKISFQKQSGIKFKEKENFSPAYFNTTINGGMIDQYEYPGIKIINKP